MNHHIWACLIYSFVINENAKFRYPKNQILYVPKGIPFILSRYDSSSSGALPHTLGLSNRPSDQEGIAVLNTMTNYKVDMGMMQPSVFDVYMRLGLTMTIFMIMIGVLKIGIVYARQPEMLRRVCIVDVVFLAHVVLYAYYQILPLLISFILIAMFFTAALISMKRIPKG
jgi:hypothetical protein